jgi:hypothetical protein
VSEVVQPHGRQANGGSNPVEMRVEVARFDRSAAPSLGRPLCLPCGDPRAVVLLCVKTWQLPAAIAALPPLSGEGVW